MKGFTLIEVLIVITVIAILLTIAVPSYREHVRASQRFDATSTMLTIAAAQEQYRSNNTTYGTLAALGITTTPEGHYTLSVTGNSSTGYTLTARAVGDQVNDQENGTSCAVLTIVVNGLSTTKTPVDCW